MQACMCDKKNGGSCRLHVSHTATRAISMIQTRYDYRSGLSTFCLLQEYKNSTNRSMTWRIGIGNHLSDSVFQQVVLVVGASHNAAFTEKGTKAEPGTYSIECSVELSTNWHNLYFATNGHFFGGLRILSRSIYLGCSGRRRYAIRWEINRGGGGSRGE